MLRAGDKSGTTNIMPPFILNGGSRVGDKCGVLLKITRARLLFQPRERSSCADFHQFTVTKRQRVPVIIQFIFFRQ